MTPAMEYQLMQLAKRASERDRAVERMRDGLAEHGIELVSAAPARTTELFWRVSVVWPTSSVQTIDVPVTPGESLSRSTTRRVVRHIVGVGLTSGKVR